MKKFIIEEEFWSLFPEAQIGIIVCHDINNINAVEDNEKYEKMLLDAEKASLNHLTNDEFSKNDVIKVWRDAFKKFKTKKGARSSIEALLKRVKNGNHLGLINPLVNIYNGISLTYALPCGGEDIDKFAGNIVLAKASGNEGFITLGSNESEPPYEGEIIYKDDEGAICRCWNWREAVRTMLTEDTKNAFLCIESLDKSREDDFKAALKDLAEQINDNLGGTCEIKVLDINNREAVID